MVEDIKRLPQWAQRRIEKLESDLKWHRDRQATILSGTGIEKDTQVGPGPQVILNPFLEQPILLNGYTMVSFRLGKDWHSEFRVAIKKDVRGEPILDINGVEAMQVHPQSNNSVQIGVRR